MIRPLPRAAWAGFAQSFASSVALCLVLPATAAAQSPPGVSKPSDLAVKPAPLQPAQNRGITLHSLHEQFARLGNTAYELGEITLDTEGPLFAAVSALNEMRRAKQFAVHHARQKDVVGEARLPRDLGSGVNPAAGDADQAKFFAICF